MNKKRPRKSNRPLAPRKLSKYCPYCSTENPWVENTVTSDHEFRGVFHLVKGPVMDCKHCDASTTTHEQDEQWLHNIRIEHALWLREEVAKAKKQLGYTVRDFDHKTCISSATISRINRAETLVDASTEKLLLDTLKELTTKKAFQTMARKPASLRQHTSSWNTTPCFPHNAWDSSPSMDEENLVLA